MRTMILMLLSVACFIVALVCSLVPTQALGWGWQTWITWGFLFWAVDVLLGGWAWTLPERRQPPA